MPAKSTSRLDLLLVARGLAPTRESAQGLILSGSVWSGTTRLDKPGTKVRDDLLLEVRAKSTPFASRAGEKLHFALDRFGVEVRGRICLDVGASTGGFTDCLLQRGARKVIAVDVGYGQLEAKLRTDPRVTVMERTNARHLRAEQLAEPPDFLCIDVSFISAAKILGPVFHDVRSLLEAVVLFKPQFEVGPRHVGRGGLVRDENAVTEAIGAFIAETAAWGWRVAAGPIPSPVPGKKSGNVERLIHLRRLETAPSREDG